MVEFGEGLYGFKAERSRWLRWWREGDGWNRSATCRWFHTNLYGLGGTEEDAKRRSSFRTLSIELQHAAEHPCSERGFFASGYEASKPK